MAMSMLGVIAAGGTGSRLGPLTAAVNKHLLPLHDKPLIYYPLATLMAANIRDIVIVTSADEIGQFKRLLGDGEELGVSLTFAAQKGARGVADVLIAARDTVPAYPFAFVLGDNFFYGPGLGRRLAEVRPSRGGHIFAARVRNPRAYGVLSLDAEGRPNDILEKPLAPPSDLAIPGLYFYASDIWPLLDELTPSERGEIEISDLNRMLLVQGLLEVDVLPRGTVWLDAGTVDAMEEASEFVSVLQKRQGLLIGCPEEIALLNGWLTHQQVLDRSRVLQASPYGEYLAQLANRL